MLDEIDREFQQQIHRLIAHDELTGLLTSKSFFSELRREAARAEAESRPFCVLMMDLDHFKEVNDTYGHLVGSRTLEETGRIIKEALRAGDVASRFGGEEFAAFLLDANYAQGLVAAERVRVAVAEQEFPATRMDSPDSQSDSPHHHQHWRGRVSRRCDRSDSLGRAGRFGSLPRQTKRSKSNLRLSPLAGRDRRPFTSPARFVSNPALIVSV